MITDALSVLRAEVQINPTGRPNLLPNPSGDGGAWFWVTPLRFTKISSVAGALRLETATGVGDAYTQTNPIRVAAGDYIGARFDTVGGTAGHEVKLRWRWFNLAGDLLSESTQTSAFNTTPGTHYKSAVQAPAGTSYAKLKIDLYNAGSPPAANAHYDFNNVMVTTDATTFANTYSFSEPVEYTNVLGPTNSIDIFRGAMQPGVIGVRVIDTSLDPAEVDALRTGRLFRVTALNDDTAVFEDLAGSLYIIRAEVEYDLTKPADKQVAISLTLTDSLQLLANSIRQNSVASISELPFVVETVGIPFVVDGESGTLIDHPEITARIPQATALDQVLLTRDSNQGYEWISKAGVFNAWTDRGTDFYGGPVTFDESSYSVIVPSFDTDNCINEVLVIRVVENPFTGETVEKSYGPYRDEAAVDKWKVVRQASFRVTGIAEADVPAFAAEVLAVNSEPVRRVNSLAVPIRGPEDITPDKALIDLYATAHIINTDKGLDLYQHVTTIQHSIRATSEGVRWLMTLGFDVAESVSSPAPVTGASGVATVPTRKGLAFHNTDTALAEGSGSLPIPLTYTPIEGSEHVYWNGLLQPPTEWTRSGKILTVTDAEGLVRNGDLFSVAYAYDSDVSDAPVSSVIVAFAASGWKWKQIGRTDATDYSASAYDDSAWSTATAPFGESNPDGRIESLTGWPNEGTTWDQATRMWARRTIAATAGTDLYLKLRLNRYHVCYLNGVQVADGTQVTTEETYTVPGSLVLASNVLAIRATDDTNTGTNTGCYFDVEVSQ